MVSRISLETLSVDSILVNPRNTRRHSRRQIDQIRRSIEEFGFTNPILVGEMNGVLAGHGRLAAAKQIGLDTVPVIRIGGLTRDQKRALAIADNKIAENASWDPEILGQELKALVNIDVELNPMVTGLNMGEIDLLIGGLKEDDADDELALVELMKDSSPPISRLGDLWLLDDHRLICGDATNSRPYRALLRDSTAHIAFTDPPYNVSIPGNVSGLGKTKHANFLQASGEMSAAEYLAFLQNVIRLLVSYSADGAIHFICMDWRHIIDLLSAGLEQYSELKNLCVWVKTNGGMGSLYRSRHELVAVFKVGKAAHVNNVQLGRFGRNRTNVWEYPGVNTFAADRTELLAAHPTVKPLAMVSDAILDCSNRGDTVLDPFAGYGTTILAAEKTGRVARAIEIDPRYVDATIKRYQDSTGIAPIHEITGLTFEEMTHERKTKEL